MCTFDFEFWAIGARIRWGKGLPKNARDIPVRFCSAIHGSANFRKAFPPPDAIVFPTSKMLGRHK